jgi:hypothetical protein
MNDMTIGGPSPSPEQHSALSPLYRCPSCYHASEGVQSDITNGIRKKCDTVMLNLQWYAI